MINWFWWITNVSKAHATCLCLGTEITVKSFRFDSRNFLCFWFAAIGYFSIYRIRFAEPTDYLKKKLYAFSLIFVCSLLRDLIVCPLVFKCVCLCIRQQSQIKFQQIECLKSGVANQSWGSPNSKSSQCCCFFPIFIFNFWFSFIIFCCQ